MSSTQNASWRKKVVERMNLLIATRISGEQEIKQLAILILKMSGNLSHSVSITTEDMFLKFLWSRHKESIYDFCSWFSGVISNNTGCICHFDIDHNPRDDNSLLIMLYVCNKKNKITPDTRKNRDFDGHWIEFIDLDEYRPKREPAVAA